jgi:lipid A ethanolaminephosphotransferase
VFTTGLSVTRTQLLLLTAAWIASVPNFATLRQFVQTSAAGNGPEAALFAFGGWLFLVTVTYLLLVALSPFFWGRSIKWLCAAGLIAAAALGYFSLFLGTQFDRNMLLNILQTHTTEATELLNPKLIAWLLAVGVLPAAIVLRAPLRPAASLLSAAGRPALTLVALVAITSTLVYAQYARYATSVRNRDISFDTVAPANIVVAGISLGLSRYASNMVRAPRGTDARQGYAIPRPRLLVFVLGETARAENHGLNGYLRDTTPRMKAAGGYYFPDTESCGTATTISVPCIFSGMSRQEFSLLRSLGQETLIDVVARSGARVIWLDNDSGCKGVCDKAEFRDVTGANDPRWCPQPAECHDEILLDGLEATLRAGTGDTLLVLHLKGSHGPAYYKRYPPAFEYFKPVCTTSDLSSCDSVSLRNGYDNSIVYTDHVIGETIALLKKISDEYATALLYVSDHGESLGEGGLYLHGLPHAIAPPQQTRVPMFAWVSPQFVKLERWDTACMARQTKLPRSHDNVYATVLGFMEVESVEYQPALDLFEPCDPPLDR